MHRFPLSRITLQFPALLCTLFLLLLPAALPAAQCTLVPARSAPRLADDLDRDSLLQALEQSRAWLENQPRDRVLIKGRPEVSVGQVLASVSTLAGLLRSNLTDRQLEEEIGEKFLLFQAVAQEENSKPDLLLTGYYQPVVQGSLTRTPPYIHPLYTVPPDLVQRPAKGGGKQVGRLVKGRLQPYWTREEIDRHNRAAGSELVWLKDRLDVFFLHVQGSGVIQLPDGSLRRVRFAAKNGRPYRSIGRYMVQTGRIPLATASMATIRAYLDAHPEELEQILYTNPSYIFFNWADQAGAVGSLGRRLTPGRTVAADQACFPAAGPAFLISRIPVVKDNAVVSWKPLHRFVLVQDSGSAINGPGRVDLFLGTGRAAGAAAGVMKEPGEMFILLLREKES